jgi:hypothetical protein
MTIGETTMIEDNEYEHDEGEEQGHGSEVETMLDAIRQKNLSQAKGHFENLINDKVFDSLEAEKIRIANIAYNGADEESPDGYDDAEEDLIPEEEEEDISSEDSEWEDITAEIEDSLEQ